MYLQRSFFSPKACLCLETHTILYHLVTEKEEGGNISVICYDCKGSHNLWADTLHLERELSEHSGHQGWWCGLGNSDVADYLSWELGTLAGPYTWLSSSLLLWDQGAGNPCISMGTAPGLSASDCGSLEIYRKLPWILEKCLGPKAFQTKYIRSSEPTFGGRVVSHQNVSQSALLLAPRQGLDTLIQILWWLWLDIFLCSWDYLPGRWLHQLLINTLSQHRGYLQKSPLDSKLSQVYFQKMDLSCPMKEDLHIHR